MIGDALLLTHEYLSRHLVFFGHNLLVEASQEDFAVFDATDIEHDVATRQQEAFIDVLDSLASKTRLSNAWKPEQSQQTAGLRGQDLLDQLEHIFLTPFEDGLVNRPNLKDWRVVVLFLKGAFGKVAEVPADVLPLFKRLTPPERTFARLRNCEL